MKMNTNWQRCGYLLVLALAVQSRTAEAQGFNPTNMGNTGNVLDIVGDWEQPGAAGGFQFQEEPTDRGPGPDPGDYAGLPVNSAARYKAQAYSPEWLTVPEHQCIPHPSTYQDRSPGGLTVVKIYDPVTTNVVAYQTQGNYGLMRTIWMDGRPHPGPNARHTFDGFSTGKWVEDKLVVETSHLKAGWIRRNGVPHSDEARMVEYFVRHDGYLTVTTAVDDPYYFEEPFIRSTDLRVNVRAPMRMTEFGGFVNGGPGPTFFKCTPIDELDVAVGRVPHFIPGQENVELETFARTYDIPLEAGFGGSETMYPEFMAKLKQMGGYKAGQASVLPAGPPRTPLTNRAVPARAAAADTVSSEHVKGQVWMITAGGQNVAVQIGDEGILVVDPGRKELGAAVLAEIRKLGGNKPVRQVIQTSSDITRLGATDIIGTPVVAGGQRPNVIAHESVGLRLGRAKASGDLIPNDTLFRGKRSIFFNGEPVEIIYVPAAHSDGDVMVYFRASDVVVTGALLGNVAYPDISVADGGTINGTVDALNRILDITVAEWRSQGGTMVIPSLGHIYDEGDVAEYRDMVTIVRDRIEDAIKRGLTLEQTKAEQLTRDYDGRYGSRPGAGSTAAFVESAYRSLKSAPARTASAQ
jgi:glyoxylase-like metal-dependent hydrolase (beta-lactamase superfamily II)